MQHIYEHWNWSNFFIKVISGKKNGKLNKIFYFFIWLGLDIILVASFCINE